MTKVNFILTDTFAQAANGLNKKYKSFKADLKNVMEEYENNPDIGTSLGGGLRKIRMAIKSKGKGESGGVRIITYDAITLTQGKNVILLYIYDKSKMSNVSDAFIKQVLNEYLTNHKP